MSTVLSFYSPQQGPKFGKKSLSFYLRNDCPRQFRLSLYDAKLLQSGAMPARSSNRPLSGQAAQAGDEYQNGVVAQVESIFGAANVHVSPIDKGARPSQRELAADMPHLAPHQFVVESIFELTDAFKSAFGLHDLRDSNGLKLEWSRLNPDIIQVLPPLAGASLCAADGSLSAQDSNDNRLRLRVIDVKLASEPGAHYFGEIAFYSMALAAWLQREGWDAQFAVSGEAAVWPGSYEMSALSIESARQKQSGADLERLLAAMEDDLEIIVFEVYALRLARFFRLELPAMLRPDWRELAWHPNFRCQNCDYLGYDWQARLPDDPHFARQMPDARHCWQEAERDDLISRVAGLTRGGAQKLRAAAPTVAALSALDGADAVWETHSNLRGRKRTIAARAQSLHHGNSAIIGGNGACATMPSWAHLKIFITLDYDPSSAISAVWSLRADWLESQPRPETLTQNGELQRHSQKWGDKASGEGVWMIESRGVEVEEREFLRFLEFLQDIFDAVETAEAPRREAGRALKDAENERRSQQGIKGRVDNKEKPSTFQIYLWDDAQFRHLQRLIGRHLGAITANARLRALAWLFPAPQLLPDEALAGRTSPICLIAGAIENHVAVPIPHHYSLLEVAGHWLPDGMDAPFVKWNYREPLTNLMPSERVHECWSRARPLLECLREWESASRNKTFALSLVTQRLYDEARAGNLTLARSAAPALPRAARGLAGVPDEARLWFAHLKLNAALARIEGETNYAQAPEIREVRGKSAHLMQRLGAAEIAPILPQINAACGTRISPDADIVIYTMSPHSRDVNMKPGEFGALLSPRGEDLWALKPAGARLPATAATADKQWWQSIEEMQLTSVDIEAIDRQNLLIVLRLGRNNQMLQFEAADAADFERDVMLDALPFDVLGGKVKLTLERIGTPANGVELSADAGNIAAILPLAAPALAPAKAVKDQSAHEWLYRAPALARLSSGRDSAPLRALLESEGVHLNPWQWTAWRAALEKRLSIIWGPPGTGKSATLGAICRAAVADAGMNKKPLRLLVTAHTYKAVDELLNKIVAHFGAHPVAELSVYRIQSSWAEAPELPDGSILNSIVLQRNSKEEAPHELLDALKNPGRQIVIVGTVPQQLHNLAQVTVKSDSAPQTEKLWFDFVLLDEASQMDVANSTLIWSKIAGGGGVVIAGDDKQMAPIHAADPPQDQENLVGSVFAFFAQHCRIARNPLNINYRSNAAIVRAVRAAGYDDDLQSHSSDLQLNLLAPLPATAPALWSPGLPFSPLYREILAPDKPLGCFVYDDLNLSGQSNPFEAQTLAALLRLLYGTLGASKNQCDRDGLMVPAPATPYSLEEFWARGVGVVAPHRAQGSLIVEALRAAFADTAATPAMIRDAVDTVERFQGQERDVIVASFGLGDPDLVAQEDEFLFKLNRFNVLISRARSKLLVMLSRAVLDHLSDDQDVVKDSALMKGFVETQCGGAAPVELPWLEAGAPRNVRGEWRWG